MTDLNFGPQPQVNFQALDAELRQFFPNKLDGISQDKTGTLIVHVTAGENAVALRGPIESVIAAHDPTALTPAQALRARRLAAAGELSNADFLAVLNAINNATTLAAAKPIMRQLLRLVYRVALAQGLTTAGDPES